MASTTDYFTFTFPGGSAGKESSCYERPGSDPWVGKIPLRRKQLPTPVFLPGEFHGQRSLTDYSPWGCKEWTWLSHFHSLTHSGIISNPDDLSYWRLPRWLSSKECLPMQEMQETWVQSLGREDSLEEEMASRSSILVWKVPRTQEWGGLQSMRSQRVGHNLATEEQMG